MDGLHLHYVGPKGTDSPRFAAFYYYMLHTCIATVVYYIAQCMSMLFLCSKDFKFLSIRVVYSQCDINFLGLPSGGPILFLLSLEVSGMSGTMSISVYIYIYIYIYICICQQHGGREVGT